MNIVNSHFTHTILESQVTHDELPIVEIGSDSQAYGVISIDSRMPIIDVAVANVYSVLTPNQGNNNRWVRQYPQISTTSTDGTTIGDPIMSLNISADQKELIWTFLPGAISSISSGQYYSVEIFINQVVNPKSLVAAKIIVKIRDYISLHRTLLAVD